MGRVARFAALSRANKQTITGQLSNVFSFIAH
jgi:hypothetical protein